MKLNNSQKTILVMMILTLADTFLEPSQKKIIDIIFYAGFMTTLAAVFYKALLGREVE